MINEIDSVVFATALGTIDYWILRQFDFLLFFNHNRNDEKTSLIVLLGVKNYIIYDVMISLTDGAWNKYGYYFATFVIGIFVEFIFFWALHKVISSMKSKHLKNKESYNFFIPLLKNELSKKPDTPVYIFIYDFENKLIEHGWLKNYSTIFDDESTMVLKLSPKSSDLVTKFDDFRPFFPVSDEDDVYIDFDKKIKIYIKWQK